MGKVHKNQTVTMSAALMSLGTLFSRLLGFVRDAAVVALFGRTVTDVFSAAFALPNFFRRLMGEGSLSVSFIPVYVESLEKDPKIGEEVARAIMTLVLGLSFTLSLVIFIFMPELMQAWLGEKEFLLIPGKLEMAVSLSQITIFYLILVTSYAYFMAISQAFKKFFWPAFAPAFFNLFFIITLLVPIDLFRIPETQLAWAVLVGGAAQFLIVFIQLYKMGKLPIPTLKVRVPGVSIILRNMGPGILGLGASQLMNIMNQKFAAGLVEGSMTHVYTTNRLLELPQSLVAISLGSALLPTLSELRAQNKMVEMRKATEDQVSFLLFLAIPSLIGLWTLSQPIVQVLFERGMWTSHDTLVVSQLVEIICFMLIFAGVQRVLIPSFYAMKNTLTPALITILTVTFHVLMAPYLMQVWAIKGLIGSVVISGALGLVLTAIFYHRKVGKFHWGILVQKCLLFLPGFICVFIVSFYGFPILSKSVESWMGKTFGTSVSLFAIVSLAVFAYFIVGHVLKVPEAEKLTHRLTQKLKR